MNPGTTMLIAMAAVLQVTSAVSPDTSLTTSAWVFTGGSLLADLYTYWRKR